MGKDFGERKEERAVVEHIQALVGEFFDHANYSLEKSNKREALRARKVSLELADVLKQYRRASIK